MAIKEYKATSGQSIYDVCLNCYQTLDRLVKLMVDSGHDGVNVLPVSGQIFLYDDSLIADVNVYQETTLSDVRYATSGSNYGAKFYSVDQNPNGNTNPNTNPANPSGPNTPVEMFEAPYQTSYTAGADGETVISVTDDSGNPITGTRVVSVEKEIKPLKQDQWFWNPNTSSLTLLGGISMAAGETIFILYSKTMTT